MYKIWHYGAIYYTDEERITFYLRDKKYSAYLLELDSVNSFLAIYMILHYVKKFNDGRLTDDECAYLAKMAMQDGCADINPEVIKQYTEAHIEDAKKGLKEFYESGEEFDD